MAVVRQRVFGFGDAAADAYLATPQGQAALQAAQAAAAKLPAGFTMGDPTSDMWGASYYNGQKIIGTSATGPDGQPHYWVGDVGNYGPVQTAAIDQAIQDAANAAYGVFSYINELRTASPEMFAVLSDPEWIALQGQNVDWNTLSSELQAKIQAVPLLYEQFTNQAQFQADVQAYQEQQAAAAAAAPPQPARYLVAGIEFLDDGTVISINGTPVTGVTLTTDEVHSLLTTNALPPGDAGPSVPTDATLVPAQGVSLPADSTTTTATPVVTDAMTPDQAAAAANQGAAMPQQRPVPPTQASDVGSAAATIGTGQGLGWLAVAGVALVGVAVLAKRRK